MDDSLWYAIRLAEIGKPLMAMLVIKEYVSDRVGNLKTKEISKECKDLLQAILSSPSLNDESWRVFVPALPPEEIRSIAIRVSECVGSI
ncbi:MAG: hypothetical protein K1T65_04155 [Candidatus Aramenus sp.]|nr:hypothetical protein [Candidatus Aramenus sp.]